MSVACTIATAEWQPDGDSKVWPEKRHDRIIRRDKHFHDMRLNKDFINDANKGDILVGPGNSEYNWYFHDFAKKTGSNPPVTKDRTNARKWLCKKPESTSADGKYFKSNLSGSPSEIERRCPKSKIELRNTQSYIKDLLKPHASKLGIEEFVAIIENLDP